MAEEKKVEEKKEINKWESRKFRYTNDVTFEFDIEVSEPALAIAEITDFIDLMARATKDLVTLRDQFQKQLEPKEDKKELLKKPLQKLVKKVEATVERGPEIEAAVVKTASEK